MYEYMGNLRTKTRGLTRVSVWMRRNMNNTTHMNGVTLNVIYKYRIPITDEGALSLPIGAEFLSAQQQHEAISVWYLVDPYVKLEKTRYRIYGTGHQVLEPLDELHYLATVQVGEYVWHLFKEFS